MTDCCGVDQSSEKRAEVFHCPKCGSEGKKMKIITLKSLLIPDALTDLDPNSDYRMCNTRECDVVYFSSNEQTFTTGDLKAPVFQKTDDPECPVCYCFGWTPAKIWKEIEETGESSASAVITGHIKAGRCGCEVNNPQGSCCLGNVRTVVKEFLDKN